MDSNIKQSNDLNHNFFPNVEKDIIGKFKLKKKLKKTKIKNRSVRASN